MGLKICVYAIAKNEQQFVERFCQSAKEADLIMIADTGSADHTCDWVRDLQKSADFHQNLSMVHIHISPWRFDLARNAVLALIPPDMDVCVSLDLDEELQPGWREEIERVWKQGETTRLRYYFDWGVGIKFKYEKIHGRQGYRWHHPCHEYPIPDPRLKEVWADTDALLVIHRPDSGKSRGSYLDLLRVSVLEDPYCPRNAFYYARELSFNRQWEQAIVECKRYLALPRATWANERCYAYRVMGRCYTELSNPSKAFSAFMMAAVEAPGTREPWVELSLLMYTQARWAECYGFALKALDIRDREMVYTVDPEVWGAKPHDLAAISAWNMGMVAEAVKHGEQAVLLAPTDERMKVNLGYYQEAAACSDKAEPASSP
jgi:tetratricopeptide (TPR) repeat protein